MTAIAIGIIVTINITIITIIITTLNIITIVIIPALGSSPSPREVHFAIVLDAGSSGTRAYLYRWQIAVQHVGSKYE